ncbi:Benzoate--CoA ligase [compost metagenome]
MLPPRYNAAEDLLSRNLDAGRGAKVAYVDDATSLTYAELDARARRFAGALSDAGFRQEERLLLCALDTVDFPTVFLGCLLAGVVPVAVNTLLTADDYAYMLGHCGARAVVVSTPLLPVMQAAIGKSGLSPVVIQAAPHGDAAPACSVGAMLARL